MSNGILCVCAPALAAVPDRAGIPCLCVAETPPVLAGLAVPDVFVLGPPVAPP